MTIHRFQRGETIRIIELALPSAGMLAADISAVSGLPKMVLRPANAARTGPDPRAPQAATFDTVFEPAVDDEPDRWIYSLLTSETLKTGYYAINSQFEFVGGDSDKTPHSIILIEESAA